MNRRAFTNGFGTVLAGAISSGASSLSVHTAIPLAVASDRYDVVIDDEILGVAACDGTTWTIVERGVNQTVAAAHVDGATITQQLTADALLHLVALAQGGTLIGAVRAVDFTSGAVLTLVGDVVEIAIAAAGMTNPMTTLDDLVLGGASGTPTRLAKGSTGQVLTIDPGSGHHVIWATPSLVNPMTLLDDLIVGGSAGLATVLHRGALGQVLTVDPVSGHLFWAETARYEPLTNPAVPDLIFTALGDVLMVRVA